MRTLLPDEIRFTKKFITELDNNAVGDTELYQILYEHLEYLRRRLNREASEIILDHTGENDKLR